MTGFAAGAGKGLPAIVATYPTDLPVETLPSIVPAKAADATTRTNKSVNSKRRVIRIPFERLIFMKLVLVRELKAQHQCVGMERVYCHRQAGDRVCYKRDRLPRPELVLRYCLDIGVNQELYRRRNAIAGYAGRTVERRPRK